MSEVYETASFYHHFEIIDSSEEKKTNLNFKLEFAIH